MDNKNLMPQQAQPIERIATGQLPSELMELSEEALQLHNVQVHGVGASFGHNWKNCELCSYDGDDAE